MLSCLYHAKQCVRVPPNFLVILPTPRLHETSRWGKKQAGKVIGTRAAQNALTYVEQRQEVYKDQLKGQEDPRQKFTQRGLFPSSSSPLSLLFFFLFFFFFFLRACVCMCMCMFYDQYVIIEFSELKKLARKSFSSKYLNIC